MTALPNTTRRELKAVAVIWLILMAVAVGALLYLQRNAHAIIYRLQYVEANRFQKSLALFTEAEKRTRNVLRKREKANSSSATAVAVPGNDADVASALELYDKAFAMDPRERFVNEHERYYIMLGDTLGAAGMEKPQLVAYTRAAISRRDFKAADDFTSRVLAAEPDDADSVLAAAQVAWYSGNKAGAERELQKLPADLWPAEAHLMRATALRESGNLDDATTELEAALKTSKSPVDVRKLLAGAYDQQNKPADAIAVLEQGKVDGGESDGNYMHTLGELLRRNGRAADSIKSLEHAARLEPNSGDVQLSLARAYQAAGHARRAARALQRATALDPNLQGQLLQ